MSSLSLPLLERLCNAIAISGDEGEVRQIVLEQVAPLADEVRVDALGNVLVTKHAKEANPLRVLLAAHMDEVGFMVVAEEGEGVYRFEPVGGVDVSSVAGKVVLIGKKRVPAVIGIKAIHLLSEEERKQKVRLEALRLDTGKNGKVQVGDRVGFATRFRRVGNVVFAKALDNRLGVSILIEVLKSAPAHLELMLAFTVQEEIGLRGARVAAHALNPDLAIAVDSTPARDLPTHDGRENTTYNTHLGAGPAIYVADAATLSDRRLVEHFIYTAEAEGLPYQIRQPGGGGTDAGAIHRQRTGIPSISISVPTRYLHTPIGLCRLDDWQNTFRLILAGLGRLNRSTWPQPTP